MLSIKILSVFLLIGITSATPITENTADDDKFVVDSDLFVKEFSKYTSPHDIVRLFVPLDSLDIPEEENDTNLKITVYFIEADIKENGVKDYKGLYYLRKGVVTKVLETGTDISAVSDDRNDVYFSATDGIYKFDGKIKKTEKYGSLTDRFIGILKPNITDVLYVLSDNHEIYKVTDGGTKKEKLDVVKNAQQFVLDSLDNLYYYGQDKVPYVLTAEGVKKIEGLPANPSYVQLITPPFVIEGGAVFASDDAIYTIYANGTSELTDVVLRVKPTAYAPEATLIQYYAYNKQIYEYNILQIVANSGIMEGLKSFFENKTYEIQSIKTRAKEEFNA